MQGDCVAIALADVSAYEDQLCGLTLAEIEVVKNSDKARSLVNGR